MESTHYIQLGIEALEDYGKKFAVDANLYISYRDEQFKAAFIKYRAIQNAIEFFKHFKRVESNPVNHLN